ncbi:MAG: hypothetical protein AAF802_06430 [Planctomycetota bacterium]
MASSIRVAAIGRAGVMCIGKDWRALMLAFSVTFASLQASAQDFQLVEPSGVVTADVFINRGVMTVNDASGNQYFFQRDANFDSIDRQYAGYWLPSVNRVVRFPRSGVGLMQVADLDDVVPHYTVSRRSVRPVRRGRPGRGGAGFPIAGIYSPFPGFSYLPPRFLSPYSFPSYGYFNFGTSLSVFPPARFTPGFGTPFGFARTRSFVIDTQVQPRPPLPPVDLGLFNSSERDVIVAVFDALNSAEQRVRVGPQQTKKITLEREAGADRVSRVASIAADGTEFIRQQATFVPPVARYELTVHEWRVQSVAIDRTGKSPNPIEDVNYQGRGLGRFLLPPGEQLVGGNIDVVREAIQSGNQGSVMPITEESDRSPLRPLTPLERMLQQQRDARADG